MRGRSDSPSFSALLISSLYRYLHKRKAARPQGEGLSALWKQSWEKQQLREGPPRAPGPGAGMPSPPAPFHKD